MSVKNEEQYDDIEKPKHYNLGIETWDFIVSWGLDYLTGNAVKYLTRWPHKGTPVKDLEKALAYLHKAHKEYGDLGPDPDITCKNCCEDHGINVWDYCRSWDMTITNCEAIALTVSATMPCADSGECLSSAIEMAEGLLVNAKKAEAGKKSASLDKAMDDWLEALGKAKKEIEKPFFPYVPPVQTPYHPWDANPMRQYPYVTWGSSSSKV